jgi:hypothetical protein
MDDGMIRAILTPHDGSPATVVLGLDDENIRRLLDNKPIHVNLLHLDPGGPPTNLPDLNVVLAYDNADLREWLQKVEGSSAAEKLKAAASQKGPT